MKPSTYIAAAALFATGCATPDSALQQPEFLKSTSACPVSIPANASDETIARLVIAHDPGLASNPKRAAHLMAACGADVEVQQVAL